MTLPPPWSGLRAYAQRLDLWPIIDSLGGPRAAAAAPVSAWGAAGLPLAVTLAMTAGPEPGDWLHAGHPAWPHRLRDGERGPVALSIEGNAALLAEPGVAVVGARSCTAWGRGWARRLGAGIAEAGGVVVSGLARGIDAEAHLAAGGRTIAVLGQGLGTRLPAWQEEVRCRILADGGLVVSELRYDEPASTFTFPIRNRVIAALARVVVVVEASRRSGARNTATHALRLGREILAVPGPPDSEVSVGCLDLIEEGATVVRSVATVTAAAGLCASPASLCALIPSGPITVAELGRRLGLGPEELLQRLGELELAGEVARLPGLRYARVHDADSPRRQPGHGPSGQRLPGAPPGPRSPR